MEPDAASTSRQIVLFLGLRIPRVARGRTLPEARGVLLASVICLPALYCLMLIGRSAKILRNAR